MKKILANFTDWAGYEERRKRNTYGGIGYYRMAKPSQCLTDYEVDLRGSDIDTFGTDIDKNWANIFKKFDAVWVVHFFNELVQLRQCYNAQKSGKLLIYDLDDNYLDLPESNPVYEKFFKHYTDEEGKDLGVKQSRNAATLTAALSLADALTVSTEPLKERMQAHFKRAFGIEKPIYVIPNMNDVADWNYHPAPKNTDKVVIGYQGSTSHNDDLAMVLPTLKRLMEKYPQLYLEFLGVVDKKDLGQFFDSWDLPLLDRVAMWPGTKVFTEYPKWLAEKRWDIGIAPLVDSAFNRSKSHIKWMEYAMYRIPCVASHVYPYFMPLQGRSTIIDGQTGFLCRPPDWEAKLERLILDKDLREKVGTQAYEAVKRDWQYKDSEIQATFTQILEDLAGKRKPKKGLR